MTLPLQHRPGQHALAGRPALGEVALDLVERLEPDELLEALVRTAMDLMHADGSWAYLVRDADSLVVRVATGYHADYIGATIARGAGVAGRVWATGRTVAVDDYSTSAEAIASYRGDAIHAVVGVPIVAGRTFIGVLGVSNHTRERAFGPDDIAGLERFVEAAAPLLARVGPGGKAATRELLRKMAESTPLARNRELRALHETAVDLLERVDPDELLGAILDRATALVDAAGAAVYLVEGPTTMRARVATGAYTVFLDGTIERGKGLAGRVWESGRAEVVDDYATWDGAVDPPGGPELHAVVTVPLMVRGDVLGVFSVAHSRPEARFRPEDVAVLEGFCRLGALSLDRTRAFAAATEEVERRRATEAELQQRNDELRALHETSLDLSERPDLDELAGEVVRRACSIVGVGHGGLLVFDPAAGTAMVRAGEGVFGPTIGQVFGPGEGILGMAITERRAIVVEDYQTWPGASEPFRRIGLRTAIAIPLLARGALVGVLGVADTTEGRRLDAVDVARLGPFGDLFAVAVERARLQDELNSELRNRQEADAALRSAEERYRTLVERLPAAVYISPADGADLLTYISPQIEQMIGYAAERFAAEPDLWRRLVHEDDLAAYDAAGRDGHGPFHVEYRMRAADGREVRLLDEFVEIPDEDGTPMHHGLVTDITERRRLEDDLRQAAKMDAVGRLAGGIAHDFNNLLTAIGGYANILVDGFAEGDERRGDAEAIVDAVGRAAGLVRQLLAFGRRQPISVASLDVNEVVGAIEGLLRRLIGEDIILLTELAAREPWVREDRSRLEQVIVNLAVNARDAMPDGGILSIATSDVPSALDRTGRAVPFVRVVVSDSGSGMDDEVRSHLFEPFYTTKGPGHGTGLGLATVFAIVDAADGHIDVVSTPGAGTTFTILLPHIPASVDAKASGAAPVMAAGGRGERILVVEDEEVVRGLLTDLLRRAGYDVVAASDGPSGIAAARDTESPFALVISDVVMPGMRGPDAVAAIRAIAPTTRAIFISGYADPELIRGLDARLIAKPFTPLELLEAVRQTLERRAGVERRHDRA